MTDEHDPTGMSHLLAGLKETGPMPEDLNERIQAALVQEQDVRAAETPDAGAAGAIPPEGPAPDDSGFWDDLDSADARPGPRRRPGAGRWTLVAAAAVVLVTGIGGVFAIRGGDDPADSAGSGQDAPSAQAETSAQSTSSATTEGSDASSVPAFVIADSGTDYSRSELGQEAAGLLDDPESAPMHSADGSLGAMSTAAGAGDCLARLDHPELQPVVLDVAHFEGTPGVLIIAESQPSGSAHAWAVTTGCEPIWPGPTEVPQD